MSTERPKWPPSGLRASLEGEREVLEKLHDAFLQKTFARRQRNKDLLAEASLYDWDLDFVKSRLRNPSREDVERDLVREGEISMVHVALLALASPDKFQAAIEAERRMFYRPAYPQEVEPFRRGLERRYRLLRSVLMPYLEDAGPDPVRPLVGKKPDRVPFDVTLITASFPPEPELAPNALRKAKEHGQVLLIRNKFNWKAKEEAERVKFDKYRNDKDRDLSRARLYVLSQMHIHSAQATSFRDLLRLVSYIRGTMHVERKKRGHRPTHEEKWQQACDEAVQWVRIWAGKKGLKKPRATPAPRKGYPRRRDALRSIESFKQRNARDGYC